MKRIVVYGVFLIILGLCSTGLVLSIPKPVEKQVVLQTYSYSRTMNEPILPYRTEQEVIEYVTALPEVQLIDPDEYPEGGISWLISLTDEGTPEVTYETYEMTYNAEGEMLSRILVPYSTWVQESTPKTYSYGSTVKEGAYFKSRRATSYGADCTGCGGEDGFSGTSAGIQLGLNSVRQSDGTWKEGITYDGYYIIATDKAIPLCTVVEISNHRWSGKGLVSGKPFKAIVLDRGGGITGSAIDLFTGSERNSGVRNGTRYGVKVEIVSFGKRTRNSLGQRMCRVYD